MNEQFAAGQQSHRGHPVHWQDTLILLSSPPGCKGGLGDGTHSIKDDLTHCPFDSGVWKGGMMAQAESGLVQRFRLTKNPLGLGRWCCSWSGIP
jgi:hypothetical protein